MKSGARCVLADHRPLATIRLVAPHAGFLAAPSRIRWLFVIARNSFVTYKGQVVDVKQVGRELGVRYVLEGSMRRAGNRVRITAQLIEAISDTHLWADRFDGSLENVFELQDQVAIAVAGIIEPTLPAAEIRRSAEWPTNDLTAYDLYLRALASAFSWERVGSTTRSNCCGRRSNATRTTGALLFWQRVATTIYTLTAGTGSSEASRHTGSISHGEPLGPLVKIQRSSPLPHTCLLASARDIHAIALVDRALEINPSFARG